MNEITMAQSMDKDICKDNDDSDSPCVCTQEDVGRGRIESLILKYHQYPEERKQQHIEWLLKHDRT